MGEYIRVLGLVAPFMYLESMVDGILKGLGEQLATFRYSLLDSALRILGIVVLLPRYGIWAFLGIMAASNLLTFALNTRRMLRRARMRPGWWSWFVRPALFGLLCTGLGLGALYLLPGSELLKLAGAAGVVCGGYLALSFCWGGLDALLPARMRRTRI